MFRKFSIQNWNRINKDNYQRKLSNLKFKGFKIFFKKIECRNLKISEEKISLEYKIHWNIIFWSFFLLAAIAITSVSFPYINRLAIIIPIMDLILARLIVSTCHSKVINELYMLSK